MEIRKYKREEERRKREFSELQEVIRELKKENKNMREEVRKIKESIDRESAERKVSAERKEKTRVDENKSDMSRRDVSRNLPRELISPWDSHFNQSQLAKSPLLRDSSTMEPHREWNSPIRSPVRSHMRSLDEAS